MYDCRVCISLGCRGTYDDGAVSLIISRRRTCTYLHKYQIYYLQTSMSRPWDYCSSYHPREFGDGRDDDAYGEITNTVVYLCLLPDKFQKFKTKENREGTRFNTFVGITTVVRYITLHCIGREKVFPHDWKLWLIFTFYPSEDQRQPQPV